MCLVRGGCDSWEWKNILDSKTTQSNVLKSNFMSEFESEDSTDLE